MFRLSEFDEKLLDSQRRDSATKELLARHESEIEERHAIIRRLQSDLGRVNAELDRVKHELGHVSDERQQLADELRKRPGENDSDSELTQIRLELGQVREERSRLISDLDRTRRQLTESEGRTHCAMQELNCVRSELNDLDIKVNEGRIQQQELKEAKRLSDEFCQTLSTDLENLKARLVDTESQLEMVRSSKEELENQLSRFYC